MKTVISILSIAAIFVFGCSNNETKTEESKPTSTISPTEATYVAFKNDKGELVCPVMGNVIASEDKATGHADFEGKRYFFCCGSCDEPFNKEPKKYADGANLKHSEGDGHNH